VEPLIDRAVAALGAGEPVILPTDTVYGLCAAATEAAVAKAYRLKGREVRQPSALVAAAVEQLLDSVPELPCEVELVLRALLPGPFTLVVPNPAKRLGWLAGANPEAIGVRVPELPQAAAEVLQSAGPVMATSANLAGGADPARLEDVPVEIRSGCAAAIDAGELPGTPSTVLDLTGDQPRVLREGAVPAIEALERAKAALATA
jgi:L-threonylcarbamoyladenylate synthase